MSTLTQAAGPVVYRRRTPTLLQAIGRSLWRGLLQAVASGFGRRPVGADQAAARDAVAVRALADRYRRTDPGFASDLYAAAARYEGSLADKA